MSPIDLSPLHQALDHVEKALGDVVEKFAAGVEDTTSQQQVDELVQRAEAIAERAVGISAPATPPAPVVDPAPAPVEPVAPVEPIPPASP